MSHARILSSFGPLHAFSIDSGLFSSYILLVRANSCSSFWSPCGCQFLQEAFSVPKLELVPSLWPLIVPWTSSNIALSCLLNFPCFPRPLHHALHEGRAYVSLSPWCAPLPAQGPAHSRCSGTDGQVDGWGSRGLSGLPDSQACALSSVSLFPFLCSAMIGK